MKIINFGSCNVDYVYSLDHIVQEGETETGDSLEVFCGGKGLNQSIAAARAGASVCHVGLIGEDGAFLREEMAKSGVDTALVKTVEGKNGHAIIQLSKNGENAIFLYPGSNEKLTEDDIDSALSHFREGDLVLLQNETNLVDRIVEKAASRGLQVMLNPSPFNEKIRGIDFSKLSYLILNEVEAAAFSGSEDPEESLRYFRSSYPCLKLVLTLGSRGSLYWDGQATLSQPIYRVSVVDTTAAGDTFTGYFAAGLAAGKDAACILREASAAAALAVSRKGAAPSIPKKDEVAAFLKLHEGA